MGGARRQALLLAGLLIGLVVWLVGLPIAGIGWGAFWSAPPGVPGGRLTFDSVVATMSSVGFVNALLHTLLLAAIVALIATPLGFAGAWLITRAEFPGRRVLGALMLAPIFLSPLVATLAWIALASPRTGFINTIFTAFTGNRTPLVNIFTLAGMVAVMVFHYASYAYLYGLAAFSAIDGSLEEAARVGGGGLVERLRRVTLPLIRPSLLASGLMIFVLAAEQFPVPGLLGRPAGFDTLPSLIYFWIEYTPTNPQGATVSGLLLALVSIVGLVGYRRSLRHAEHFATVGGKGSVPAPRVKLSPIGRSAATGAILVYVAVAFVIPLCAVVFTSFLRFLTPIPRMMQFTFENFERVLVNAEFVDALVNTIIIAGVVSVGTTLLGGLVAYCAHHRLPGSRALDYLSNLPAAVPGLTLAIGMLWVYAFFPLGLYGTLWIIVVAHAARFLSHSVRFSTAGLVALGKELDEAGRVAGASVFRRVREIHAPLIKDSMRVSVALLVIYSIIEISSTILLFNRGSLTISVFIWQGMSMSGTVQAFAAATLQCALIGVVLLFAGRWIKPTALRTA